jgi:hypothetical protein
MEEGVYELAEGIDIGTACPGRWGVGALGADMVSQPGQPGYAAQSGVSSAASAAGMAVAYSRCPQGGRGSSAPVEESSLL